MLTTKCINFEGNGLVNDHGWINSARGADQGWLATMPCLLKLDAAGWSISLDGNS